MNAEYSGSWVPLGGILIFFLITVGVLVMFVALLTSKRTRRIGLSILGVLGVGLSLMVFLVFLARSSRGPTVIEGIELRPASVQRRQAEKR